MFAVGPVSPKLIGLEFNVGFQHEIASKSVQ
jgi:hypothetical protein